MTQEGHQVAQKLTSTILLGRRLPLVEILPRAGFYDFENKYTDGASDYRWLRNTMVVATGWSANAAASSPFKVKVCNS